MATLATYEDRSELALVFITCSDPRGGEYGAWRLSLVEDVLAALRATDEVGQRSTSLARRLFRSATATMKFHGSSLRSSLDQRVAPVSLPAVDSARLSRGVRRNPGEDRIRAVAD
jgi:hypothetical protein